MELSKIPGYTEAIAAAAAQEEALRDRAFIDCPQELCGVLCKPLTLAHLVLLFAARSPFFYEGPIGPGHVAQFLWLLSIDYLSACSARLDSAGNAELAAREARQFADFSDRIFNLQLEPAIAEIQQFLDENFMDRPPSSGPAQIAITSFVANFIDEFAAAYGWSDERILATPLPRLYQYLRRIERRQNSKAVFFSKLTDRVKREIFAAWRKANPKTKPKLEGNAS